MTNTAVQVNERAQGASLWLEQIWKDTRFAVRSLSRAPGFTFTVVIMLSLGIGLATMLFILSSWTVTALLPFPDPGRLFLVGFKSSQVPAGMYRTALHFHAYQQQTEVFSELAAAQREMVNVLVDGDPVVSNVVDVSADAFRMLGVQPMLGRGFLPDEYRAGASDVVVIHYDYWRKRFGKDPNILSREMIINDRVCAIVGVLAPQQPFPPPYQGDVYRPLVLRPDPSRPFGNILFVIGRLKPDVSPEVAQQIVTAIELPGLPPPAAAFLAEQQTTLLRLSELGGKSDTFWVTAVAGGLLYAIACLNAMNLMLLRLAGRRGELSIRLALGGTRWQIVRLVGLECVVLALAAGAVVTIAAKWFFPYAFAVVWNGEAASFPSYWDPRTLGCIFALSLFACVTVVLVPVWRLLKAEINLGLKETGAGAGESRAVGRLKDLLVVFQAALAVVLLAGTGLLLRSIGRLQDVDLGFSPDGKMKVSIAVPRSGERKPDTHLQLFERLEQRLAALPGVREVSIGQDSLFVGGARTTDQLVMPGGTQQPVFGSYVDADFPGTAGLTMKLGRWFSGRPSDREVVVNETFARTRFGNENPIGQSFRLASGRHADFRIVGVVGDIREAARSAPGLRIYYPHWANPMQASTLLLRLDRDPSEGFESLVRRAVYEVDPQLVVGQVVTINKLIDNRMWAERYALTILRALSAVGLLLSAAGLFSVIAYSVNSRMREFGVRVALGAGPSDLRWLVMRRGLAPALLGVFAGSAVAIALTRFMDRLLFETAPYDPMVYAGVAAMLVSAAAAACWLPARRAARVDVASLLRTE